MSTTDRSLIQTILSLLDVLSSHKTEGRSWIHLLSLLCIFTIVSQENNPPQSQSSAPVNPLQNLLGDLLKGTANHKASDNAPANTLMSLLPLLNSPQLKSKLTPSNIATVMNVMQNLTTTPASSDEKTTKSPPPSPPQTTSTATVPPLEAPSASQTAPPPLSTPGKTTTPTGERYLDWKNSF